MMLTSFPLLQVCSPSICDSRRINPLGFFLQQRFSLSFLFDTKPQRSGVGHFLAFPGILFFWGDYLWPKKI